MTRFNRSTLRLAALCGALQVALHPSEQPAAQHTLNVHTGTVEGGAGGTKFGSVNGGPGFVVREDLSDVYRLLAVTECPVISGASDDTVKAVFSEWTEDTLDAPDDGSDTEGKTAVGAPIKVPLRLKNVAQINSRVPEISGTSQEVDLAGIDDPMAWAKAKRMKEIKRSMERRVCLDATASPAPVFPSGALVHRVGGAAPVAGKTRSLAHFLAADPDRLDGLGAAPCFLPVGTVATYAPPATEEGVGVGWTLAELESLTLDHINTGKQRNYVAGGSASDLIVSPNQKAWISGMVNKVVIPGGTTAAAYHTSQIPKNQLSTNVTLIETAFGDLKIVPDLFIGDTVQLGVDFDMLSIGWLRKLGSEKLAKTGDTDSELVLGEWALKPKAVRAHFAISGAKASA